MRLTEDILFGLGFHGEGKDVTNKPAHRIEPKDGYPFQIQVVLGDYPETNPNSGVVSVYMRPTKDIHMLVDSTTMEPDHVTAEIDGVKYGIKYIDDEGINQPIAWYVTTVERLQMIYKALTGEELHPRNSDKENQ